IGNETGNVRFRKLCRSEMIFVSGPITAKGVSVAIRSYPKKLQKSRGARRCPSSSPKGSDGLGWALHHGEGCCQGVAMCPDGHRRRSIIRALPVAVVRQVVRCVLSSVKY